MFLAEESQISLLRLVRRHWKVLVAVTLLCMVIAALVTSLLPHRYQSEMKFLVNNERADLVITPGKDQSSAAPSEVSETEVNSEIELLKSHDLVQAIVLNRKLYLPSQRDKSAPPTRRSVELASLELSKGLSVSSMRKTNIIDVTYKSSDPDSSVAILQDIGDGYLASHLAAHSAHGTNKFFGEQVARYANELAQARAALAQYHQREQLFSMPQQQSTLVTRLGILQGALQDVSSQVEVQKQRLGESTRQLDQIPDRVVTQVKQGSDHGALQQLEVMLTQLSNKRVEMTTKFKPTDRLVVELDDQIANTRREIDQIRTEQTVDQTTDINPVHQSLSADFARSKIELTGLQAQRAGLTKIEQYTLKQLGALDQSSLQLDTLEQHVKEAEDNYVLYTHRFSEAQLDQALDQEKLSNVVMIERPVAAPFAVTPNLTLNLIFGLLFGLCLSFGWSYWSELRDSRPPSAPAGSLGLHHTPVYQPVSGD